MFRFARLPVFLAVVLVIALGALAVSYGPFRLTGTGANEATSVNLDDGLVGYWKFEDLVDGVIDSSGKANNGLRIKGSGAPGRYGRAVRLDGDDDAHVSIPASQSLNDFSDQITVSAWVLPHSPPEGFVVVASRQIEALQHPDQFYLGFGLKDGVTHYKWHLGTIKWWSRKDRSIYAGTPASDRWIHMAGVYDGTIMRLYIDGEEIGSQAQTGKIRVDDNPVTIGGEENGAEPHIVDAEFEGLIDEVRIYNRALNSAAIEAIYLLPPP